MLHQDGTAAVDRPAVRGEDPTFRFFGCAVFVADAAEAADLSAVVVRKLSPVASSTAVLPVKLCHRLTAKSTQAGLHGRSGLAGLPDVGVWEQHLRAVTVLEREFVERGRACIASVVRLLSFNVGR